MFSFGHDISTFLWSIYQYPARLLHWQWSKDMEDIVTSTITKPIESKTKHKTAKHVTWHNYKETWALIQYKDVILPVKKIPLWR